MKRLLILAALLVACKSEPTTPNTQAPPTEATYRLNNPLSRGDSMDLHYSVVGDSVVGNIVSTIDSPYIYTGAFKGATNVTDNQRHIEVTPRPNGITLDSALRYYGLHRGALLMYLHVHSDGQLGGEMYLPDESSTTIHGRRLN